MNCTPQSLIEASRCWDCIPPGMQGAVQTMLMCEWANAPAGEICDDPVVLDWLQRLADDFQPMPSVDTINAVCDFCEALRLYGIMDKMLVVNPIIWDTQMGANSFLSMRYPLIYQVGNGNSPFINHNFVAADLDGDGLQGADLKYFDSGFIPSTHWGIGTESGGMTLYQSDVTTNLLSAEVDIGASDDPVDDDFYTSTFDPNSGSRYSLCWNGASQITDATAELLAFYSANRITDTDFRYYQASGVTAFNQRGLNVANQAGQGLVDLSCHFMAYNVGGLGSLFSYKKMSFMAIHEGLTANEAEDFFNAVQDLRIALGGGWL